jgi:non-heme chloroperoxidase
MVRFTTTALAPLVSFAEVALGNGVRLHYARQGPERGPAILLLHGYSDSSFSFSRVMPLLPPDVRVIAPDLRGHGHSSRPANGYRIGDFAGDVITMMHVLNVPEAVIVGHSMGSFIAQAIADRAPERTTSLVLIGSAPTSNNAAVQQMRTAVDALRDPVDLDFVRAFQYSTIATPVPTSFMDTAIANSRRMPAHVWQKTLQGLLEFQPFAARPLIRTLVLGGRRDSIFSAVEQTELARQFPYARLHLFEYAGHSLHWELPQTFVDALLRFAK